MRVDSEDPKSLLIVVCLQRRVYRAATVARAPAKETNAYCIFASWKSCEHPYNEGCVRE